MRSTVRLYLGLGGALLILFGVFLPAATIPLVGGINYIQISNHGEGFILGVLAIVSAVLVAQKKYQELWFTSLLALGTLLFSFATFYFRLSGARSSLEGELEGNPFAGLGKLAAHLIQIGWGWGVLVVGALLLLTTAAFNSGQSAGTPILKMAAVVIVLVFVVGVGFVYFNYTYIGFESVSRKVTARDAEDVASMGASAGAVAPEIEEGEATAYLPNVTIYEVWGGYAYGEMSCTKWEGRKCAAFRGKLKNEGDKSLREVEVTAYFPDAQGNIVFEKSYVPVSRFSIMGNNEPLKPGYIRKFGYIIEDCPSECVPEKVRLEVTKVEFVGE